MGADQAAVRPLSSFVLTTALLLIGPPPVVVVGTAEPLVLSTATEDQATLPPAAQAETPPTPVQQAAPDVPEEDAIVVTGRRHDPSDPFQSINAESFAITQAVDTAVMRPVAKGYQRILPAPVRDGIRNILDNLREPVFFINFLLQLKPGKAVHTLGRFAVNTTVGVGGLVDVAKRKPFKLQRRVNGFADTLGFYGVKTGIFFYLPIIGPTTVRDLIGSTVDRFVLPFAIGGPFRNAAVTIPMGVFGTIDHRAQFDETLETLKKETPDSYVASREFYLARRQAEIDELRGKGHRVVRPNPGSVKPLIEEPAAAK